MVSHLNPMSILCASDPDISGGADGGDPIDGI